MALKTKQKPVRQYWVPRDCYSPEEHELFRRWAQTNKPAEEDAVFNQLAAKYPSLTRRGRNADFYREKVFAAFAPMPPWRRRLKNWICDVGRALYQARTSVRDRLSAWRVQQ